MEIGYIKPRKITEEMEESYIDYAMSVIVSRALPDVRDGLKPVHRRILYSMHEMGLSSGAKHRKSAAIVGNCLGRYHPHGDIAVYDALVRMAQYFSLRYPLIDGQGNFGSMDGDRAAAQRYTEAKMTKIAEEMLKDIEKDTVNWTDNYDATRKEPTVLPANIPNLLLNGSMGIAVGMATNIPPHNLGEVADALSWLIDHPKGTSVDLMRFIKGPDFPTGGEIYNQKEIIQAYTTGKGKIITRAKAEIVERAKDKFQIVITEIPYQVNKASLVKRIAELVKAKTLPDIKNIRDESDRQGLRIAIDLKKDSFPQKVLNRLFKLTDLEKPFYLNMLALVDGIQPRVLTIKEVLDYFLRHRKVVITRRTKYDLKKTQERIHILKGLKIALEHINEVIKTIKASRDKIAAHKNLIKKFKLTPRQAEAILEMKLQTLAGLERKKIIDELKEKLKLETNLKAILASPKKVLGIIKKDLEELKLKYGDPRKTRVFARPLGKLTTEDLIEEKDTVIVLTKGGYIKRLDPSFYHAQGRGGIGIIGSFTRDGDIVEHFVLANTLDNLLFFTDRGKVYGVKAYEIPQSTRTSRGQAIVNFVEIRPQEKVTSIFAYRGKTTARYLVMATKNGIIKKTKVAHFDTVRRSGLIAIKLKGEDRLSWVKPSHGLDEILLVTAFGKAIRFKETDIRSMGRATAGVMGIRLGRDDEAIAMDIIEKLKSKNQKSKIKGLKLLVLSENGFSKKTELKKYKVQRRGGKGLITAKISSKTGQIVYAKVLAPQEETQDLLVISQKGQIIRTPLKNISLQGRATQGVKVMRLKSGDKATSAICI